MNCELFVDWRLVDSNIHNIGTIPGIADFYNCGASGAQFVGIARMP